MQRVCIVGAGAIGGLLGTRLALCDGVKVSALARGATLTALRDHGWRLHESGGQLLVAPAGTVSDDPGDLGPQDLVILALKAQALPALAPTLRPLLAPECIVLPAMNGVPWWFSASTAALATQPLESVDPGGGIAAAIPLRHVVGCVVHASAATTEPGVAAHRMGRGLIIGNVSGAPNGCKDAPVVQIESFRTNGNALLPSTCSPRLDDGIWYALEFSASRTGDIAYRLRDASDNLLAHAEVSDATPDVPSGLGGWWILHAFSDLHLEWNWTFEIDGLEVGWR